MPMGGRVPLPHPQLPINHSLPPRATGVLFGSLHCDILLLAPGSHFPINSSLPGLGTAVSYLGSVSVSYAQGIRGGRDQFLMKTWREWAEESWELRRFSFVPYHELWVSGTESIPARFRSCFDPGECTGRRRGQMGRVTRVTLGNKSSIAPLMVIDTDSVALMSTHVLLYNVGFFCSQRCKTLKMVSFVLRFVFSILTCSCPLVDRMDVL